MTTPLRPLRRAAAALVATTAGLVAGCGGSDAPPSAPIAVLAPSPEGAANSARPAIRWEPVPGAASYRVTAWADEAREQAIETRTVAEPTTTLDTPLADGAVVHLDVEALGAQGAVKRTGASRFVVRLLPEDFPAFRVVAHDAARAQPGLTLFNLQDPLPPTQDARVAAFVLVNAAGEVLWWMRRPPGFATDVRVLPNGNLLFQESPNEGEPRCLETTWDGVERWRSRDGAYPHHECALGPEGGYLYLTTILTEVDGEPWEGDGIELTDPATGAVRWSWDLADHVSTDEYDPLDILLPGVSLLGRDWTHANAVVWDEPRGLLWLSVRNLDRLLAIDYPSGEVRAVIGDGGLGGADVMDHQHAPEVEADGSLLYYDNGNGRFPPRSRVARLRWDEAEERVTETWSWADEPVAFDPAVGDVDRLPNGNVLAVSGTTGIAAQKPATLVEVTPAGEVVWRLETTGGFRLIGFWIYRAERIAPEQVPAGVLPF